jgi:hypothetical protein
MLSNLRIVRSAEFSELSNGVLLTNLKSNNRAIGEVLNEGQVLGEDILVDAHEFFNDRAREVEDFHGRDLEASLEDAVDDLTELTTVNNVRLDQTKRAVVKDGSSLHRSLGSGNTIAKPEAGFSLITSCGVGSVDSVSSAVGTKHSSEGVRSFLSSLFGVSRSVKGTHASDGTFLH